MQASPSKARAQALESHSWSIVLSWLSTLYYPLPHPAIERNGSTLTALQALMAENIAATRLQELLGDAKREELAIAEHDKRQELGGVQESASNPSSLLVLLGNSLSEAGKESLECLAASAVLLGCCPSFSSSSLAVINESLSPRVIDLTQQASSLEGQLLSVEALTLNLQVQTTQTLQDLSTFRTKTAQLSSQEDMTDSRPSTPSNGLGTDYSHFYAQTLQHQRETQQLMLKSAEYKSRIDTLERQLVPTDSASSTVIDTTALVSKQQLLHDKKKQINALEAQVKEFHPLPPDLDASRKEVQRFQRELDNLKIRRDELFETI